MGLLRVYLAVCVILSHCPPPWKNAFLGGLTAVKIFFIISGFYMSLILSSKYTGKNHSFRLFITNRFLRIYPVYWTVLAISLLTSLTSGLLADKWLLLSPYMLFHHLLPLSAWVTAVTTNLVIFGQDAVMFLGLKPPTADLFFAIDLHHTIRPFYSFLIVPQAWTLGIELTFYLFAPLIVGLRLRSIFCLMAISFLIRMYIYIVLGWDFDPWTHRFFPTEFIFFLLGNISYRIYAQIKDNSRYAKAERYCTGAFFLFILLYPHTHFSIHEEIALIPYYLLTCLCLPFIFNVTKKLKIDNRIGELSYPIYIIHVLVIYLVKLMLGAPPNSLEACLSIALSVLGAYVLLKLVADPIEKIRQMRVVNTKSTSTAA